MYLDSISIIDGTKYFLVYLNNTNLIGHRYYLNSDIKQSLAQWKKYNMSKHEYNSQA